MHSSIQTEIDASYLYGVLAAKEEDTDVAEIFRQMSEIEKAMPWHLWQNTISLPRLFRHLQVGPKRWNL